jgi:S-adenosylmethionine:tRNA ribosyltransferase-isomerase
MDVRDFDFDLPADLIAQEPAGQRSAARLLHLDRSTGSIAHSTIGELPKLFQPGDVVVVNNTRVFSARLIGRRVPSGGAVECLLIRRLGTPSPGLWEALVHPGQKLKPGARVVFEGVHTLHAEILERRFFGRRVIRLWTTTDQTLTRRSMRSITCPCRRIKRGDTVDDRDRYQTVFARSRRSVAAPTAGLHFTAPCSRLARA